jgi:hypothetical protein
MAKVTAAVPDATMGEADLQRIMKELAVYSASTRGHACAVCLLAPEGGGGREAGEGGE